MNIELLIMVVIAAVSFWAVYTDAKEIRALKKRVRNLELEDKELFSKWIESKGGKVNLKEEEEN